MQRTLLKGIINTLLAISYALLLTKGCGETAITAVSTPPFTKSGVQNCFQMYYVYILKDENGLLYIGRSDNLKQRIKAHLGKNVYTTKRMLNPRLIYYEAYSDRTLSQEREKKLKQFGSSYSGLLKRLKLK